MRRLIRSAMVALLLACPLAVQAADGYVTVNLNMRAGPDVEYPLIATIPAGTGVTVEGCTEGWEWCDVIVYGNRGWVVGDYIEYEYEDERVVLPDYGARIGIPVVTFVVGSYWGSHYRHRPFYRDRYAWYHRRIPHRPPPHPRYRHHDHDRHGYRSPGHRYETGRRLPGDRRHEHRADHANGHHGIPHHAVEHRASPRPPTTHRRSQPRVRHMTAPRRTLKSHRSTSPSDRHSRPHAPILHRQAPTRPTVTHSESTSSDQHRRGHRGSGPSNRHHHDHDRDH